MAITIHKILNRAGDYSVVQLTHGTETFDARVWDKDGELFKRVGEEGVLIELQYDRFLTIKILDSFNNDESSIKSSQGEFLVKGRVFQILEWGEDTLIDLYLQTGPEFLSILKSEFGNVDVKVDQGVEVLLAGLKFIPN